MSRDGDSGVAAAAKTPI